MWKFFVAFLTTYSIIHAIIFLRVKVLLPESRLAHSTLLCLFAVMTIAPVTAVSLERAGHLIAAKPIAHAAFFWMGCIFLAFWAVLLMDFFDFFSWSIRSFTPLILPPLAGKRPVFIMLAFVACLVAYSFHEARQLRVERVHIETHKLPMGTDRLRIAQISDLHLGLLVHQDRLNAALQKIAAEAPDILVSTGDLVDSSPRHLSGIAGLLRHIEPPHGKYAVTGNHEFYSGLAQSLAFYEQAGFTVLRGQATVVDSLITLAGVDDPTGGKQTDETALLRSSANGLFMLLLKHRPDVVNESIGHFDLQLSGHTHGGQMFPFRYIVALFYPYVAGFYPLEMQSILYTSRGTGTWGPPMRLLSPPHVTIIDIVRIQEQAAETL